ncbi:MAG: hypothetical protein K9J06_07955 [Flavobacteriales bacterium]|nr:hypothetical protein [Flavobacteriales bacterium]
MNLLLRIITISVIASALQWWAGFWWLAPLTAFVVEAAIGKGDRTGFFSGFYGIAVPWMAVAFYIDHQSGSILTYRLLELFKLPRFATVLVLITGLVGGLAGGVASLSASWVKAYFKHA